MSRLYHVCGVVSAVGAMVEYVKTETLQAVDWNPRYIPAAEMAALVRSIETYGFVEPLVVNRPTMEVLGGNQRLQAARQLGLPEVPVVFVDLDDSRARALNLALNRIGGEFDIPKLTRVLDQIMATAPADLELTGFTPDELDELLGEFAQDVEETAVDADSEVRRGRPTQSPVVLDETRLTFYVFHWGDLQEQTSAPTYREFFETLRSWQRRVNAQESATIDDFIRHLLEGFHERERNRRISETGDSPRPASGDKRPPGARQASKRHSPRDTRAAR